MEFVNRRNEIVALTAALDAPPALFVLYGRRRVGKTAILREVCRGRRHVFLTADLGTTQDHLRAFAAALSRDLGEPEWDDLRLPGWEEALRVCLRRALHQELTLVLDEFQHFVSADPTLASVLQRIWDGEAQDSKLSIVLCGSCVSFMEKEVLGVRNPLYGRRTGQLRLPLLETRHAGLFFPGWTAQERMVATGILGGVPAYLQLFRPDLDLESNVVQTILGQGAPLLEEPRFLMMEEVREPQAYFSVCRAMAHGRTSPNEIANASGVPRNGMTHVLETLRGLCMVERRVPATVRNPERTRRSMYRLQDSFLRFWFRFVLPNRTQLEAGDAALVWRRKIEPQLAHHVAVAFEDAAAEFLREANRHEQLPAIYDQIGPWWRRDQEVDIVGVSDDGPLLMAECKWSTNPVGIEVLEHLVGKTTHVMDDLPRPPSRVDYALFSRVGFTSELQQEARTRGVLLATVDDIFAPTAP